MRIPAFLAVFGLLLVTAEIVRAQIGRAAAQLTPLVETDAARVGASVRLALRVVLPAELHVQSDQPRDPALIPTLLTVEAPAGITVEEIIYPAAQDLKQQGLPTPLAVFGHDFVIGVRATIAANAPQGDLTIKARLRYQACNDKVCFPPATAETTWTVRTVPAMAGLTPRHRDIFAQLPVPAATAAATAAPTARTLVALVRSTMAQDFPRAEEIVKAFQAEHGVTPEMLLAKSWLGRGALYAGNLDAAEAHAQQTYDLGVGELRRRAMDQEGVFPTAFGAAIEVLGHAAAARGRKTEAVAFLQDELAKYGDTSIHKRTQKNINLISLVGTRAPALDLSEPQGVTPPTLESLQGRVVLLFFWAHWCSDCKAQGPVLERLMQRYGAQGLTVVAPTQRFGYAAEGKTVPADEETRHIAQVRQTHYAWLAQVPVTLNDTNHKRYGVSSTPTIVVVDRAAIVRLYNPGQVPEAQLDALIRQLVAEGATAAAAR